MPIGVIFNTLCIIAGSIIGVIIGMAIHLGQWINKGGTAILLKSGNIRSIS